MSRSICAGASSRRRRRASSSVAPALPLPGNATAPSDSSSDFQRDSMFGWMPRPSATSATDRPYSTTCFTASSLNSRLCFLRDLPIGSSSLRSLATPSWVSTFSGQHHKHEWLTAQYRGAMQEALQVDRLEASEEAAGSWAATYWKSLVGGKRVQ